MHRQESAEERELISCLQSKPNTSPPTRPLNPMCITRLPYSYDNRAAHSLFSRTRARLFQIGISCLQSKPNTSPPTRPLNPMCITRLPYSYDNRAAHSLFSRTRARLFHGGGDGA